MTCFNKSSYIFCSLANFFHEQLFCESRGTQKQKRTNKTWQPKKTTLFSQMPKLLKKTGRWILEVKSISNKRKHELCIAGGKIDGDEGWGRVGKFLNHLVSLILKVLLKKHMHTIMLPDQSKE